MEPVKIGSVKKGKNLVIKGFEIRFQKTVVENMEIWLCRNKKCKCCIK
jgi:hypothetical protein